MASRTRRKVGKTPGVAASLRQLVEAIAEGVVEKARRRLPERGQIRDLERQLTRLTKRITVSGGKVGIRRVGRPRADRQCNLPGCGLPHVAHGFCSKHYQSWRRRRLKKATRARRRS